MSRKKDAEKSWYFGNIGMARSVDLLQTYGEEGDFLVRDSESHVGMYVCEVRGASKIRRFRIIKEDEQYHTDGSHLKFGTLDKLIDHNMKVPPHGRDQNQLILKKPFVWPSEENPDVEGEDKIPSSKRLSQKVERLKLLIIEKEKVSPELKDKYLEEEIRKIQRKIPEAQSVREVWQKEKAAIKKSFRKRTRSEPEISEVAVEEIDKIKQDSDQNLDAEKHVMQRYVEINGGYLELKINLQEHLFLFAKLMILYEELKEQLETALSDCEKDLSESGKKSEDQPSGSTNVYVKLAKPINIKDKIDYLIKMLKELSELEQKLQATIRNAKNASQEFIEETDRGHEEQSELRYTSSDIGGMCQINNLIRIETEQNLKEVEKVMEDISEIESSIQMTLELFDPKFLATRGVIFPTLKTLCTNLLPAQHLKTTTSKAGRRNFRGTYSATVRKNSTRYACIRAGGNWAMLQGPSSAVTLRVPPNLDAVVMGHAHTDAKPFLRVIPQTECLISPIAEYHCETKDKTKGWFRIQIPHCVRNKKNLPHVIVRHGDIYKNIPFTRVPENIASDSSDIYFEIDEKYIIIHTVHFSQFICTIPSCQQKCFGNGKAFVFGGMTPLHALAFTPLRAAVRLYMCSPLFTIYDYRQKLIEIEQNIQPSRHLIVEEDVMWNPEQCDLAQHAQIVVKFQTPKWDARKPIKFKQTWIEEERRLIHGFQLSDMSDMLHCQMCKQEPSSLATFDLEHPTSHHGALLGELYFSAFLQMFLPSKVPILEVLTVLEVHVDIFPLHDPAKQQTNRAHRMLLKVAKKLVCTIPDLNGFGLGLGFTHNEIIQKMTNYPQSVETAAWSLACVWWDEYHDSYEEKIKILMNTAESMGKQETLEHIKTIFGEGRPPVRAHSH